MIADDELRDAMARAMVGFSTAVATIEPDQWELPSPCAGWTVFDVVDHVVAGDRFVVRALDGASLDEATEGLIGLEHRSDAVEQVEGAAAAALRAFAEPLDRMVDHRVGSIPARRFLGFRVIDQLGHTWDLAAATDRPLDLDPGALRVGLEIALAELETLERSTNFATSAGDVAESTDALTTFLTAIGRRGAD